MAKKSSQELAQDVIAGRSTGINMNSAIAKEIVANRGTSLAQKEARSYGFEAPTKLVDYTVPMSAVYDRLSDGSYVAKYENYLGATGNEDRLAKQQSTGEQWKNGLLKAGIKTINYAADSLVGTAYGIAKGVTSGDFTDLYDNEVTNFFDDANKSLDNSLHNYYTDEQKSMGLIKSLGTANFWANDVAGGLAFVGGAVVSNALVGALTGGATLGASAARLTMKTLGKSAINEAGEAAAKTALKNFTKAKNAKLLGDKVGTGLFLARTSNFEAGMEARQNLKDATDKFYSEYEEKNGKAPSYEESKNFLNSATKAANGVYAANMAILSVSNAVMFGKKILPSSFTDKLTGLGERVVGLGVEKSVVDGVVTQTMKKANKLQKIAGRTSNLLGKPLSEGLYEEGFQGVAGKTMQNYLDAKYSDDNLQGISLTSAMYDGFAEQYGTNEGWKEMGVGMIIGFAGGAIQPGGKFKDKIPGFGANSWSEQRKAKELSLERSNKGLETLANLNRTSAVAGMTTRSQAEDGGKFSTLIDTVEDYNYIKSQEGMKENSEILEDYNTTIDSMEFSNNKEILSMLQESGMEVEQYKATLKDNFKSTLDDYTFAKKAVAALGLSERMKDEKGNIIEVAEAQTFNIMAGKNALRNAQEIGKQLDKVIGTDGIFDYYQHYNNLSEDKKQQADSLLEKQKELKDLQDIALTLSQESNRIAQIPGDNLDVESKRKNVSEQAVTTQNRIASLAQEIDVLTKALDTDLTAAQFDLTGKLTEMPKIGVMNAVQEIEKIDLYTQSLRSMGRQKEAQKIEQVVKEFKTFSFAHKEMIDFHNKMLDSNFFSTKEGKSFTQKLLGKKYEMSDDFKELVEKNSDIIDRSLELNGLTQYGEFKDQWKVISENPEISDREKYRMESLIRMNLATWAIQNIAEELRDASREMNISTTVEQGPIKKGDTILTKTEVAGKDLNNLEVLNKLIKEITDQLDYVVNYNTKAQAEVNQLKSQLNDLELRKAELEKLLENEPVVVSTQSEQADSTEEMLRRSKLDSNLASFELAVLAKSEGVDLSTLTREEYVDYAIKNGYPIDDSHIRSAPELRNAIDINDAISLRASLRNSIKDSTKKAWDLWTNSMELLANKTQAERYLAPGVRLLSGTKNSNSWLFFDVNDSQVNNTQAPHKSYFSLKDFNDVTPQNFEDFLKFLQEKGYKGYIKTFQDLTAQGVLLNDQFVMHGDTQAYAELGEQLAKEFFKEKIKSTGIGKDAFENGKSKSYSQVLAEKVKKDILDNINNPTVQPNAPISDTEQAAPVNKNREELGKINQEIEAIQKKIDEISKDYRILESEEYKRFEALSKKKEKGTINNQEEVELESLRESIDRWTFITGVVVDGFRLSDLIMQKVVLENTPISGTNQVVVPTSEDTLSDVDFDDISGKANYSYLQVYDNVVVAQDGDNIVLHHINMEDFIALVGEDIIEEYEIPFVPDASGKGNLQIRVQDVENINKSENVRIVPPKANVGRVGALLTRTTTMASSPELKSTKSKFNNEINYGLGHNPTAVYASKVGDELNIVVDLTNPYNKEYIDELGAAYRLVKNKEKPTKKDLESLEAAKTAVIENLSLLAMNGKDAVGTLKGIRNVTKDDKNDHIFEALRVAMMDNNQLIEDLIKDGAAGLVNLSLEDNEGNMVSPKIKIQKVLPGIPNYNYIENSNGEVVVENRPLIESQIDKVETIGYMENGTVKTQDNIGVDTTFLRSLQKRSKEDKIPFIVLSVGGKRIAYPVKVNTISQEYEADFRALYEAKGLDDTTKAANLNRYLASKGIDIKISGNAFVSFGETNLNDTFFNEKLAQLNNINYFYSVEEWLNPDTSMKDVLSNQVTVDIDVNNPFHSPKIQMDFSDLNLKRASDLAQKKAQNTAKTKAKKAKDINATNVTSVLFGKECK